MASVPNEQRDAVINKYEALFDEAGPEKEPELINKLDSPLKVAIAVLREKDDEQPPLTNDPTEQPPEDIKPGNDETGEADAGAADVPVQAEAFEKSISEQKEYREESGYIEQVVSQPDEPEYAADESDGMVDDDEADENEKASALIGKTFAAAGISLLSLLIPVLSALLILLLIPPVAAGFYVILAGLVSFGYVPDALLLLGAGAIAFSIGTTAIWLIIRACVSSLKALICRIKTVTDRRKPRGGGEPV